MLSLQNITKQYGTKQLFKNLSFQINDGEHIALVGSNGAGKTTLMKIITNEIDPDAGKVIQSRYNTTGYLPQDGIFHKGKTLYEEVETTFSDLIALNNRIKIISDQISSYDGNSESSHVQELIKELGDVQHILEQREGYHTETKIKQIIFGLGFRESDLDRKTEEFSGGWHMRIELAKLLLNRPTVLLLDEPTNHLDIESLEWLESYLKSYQGSIILVSHDSRFLDNLAHRIFEISLGKVTKYTGNYSSYIQQKTKQIDILQSTYDNQQRLLQKTNKFIEKFRYKSTKARQVQSRVKMIDKIVPVTLEKDEKSISFDFPEPHRSGRIIAEVKEVKKSYESFTLFRDLSLTIERGDRIAILGANGSGKSTLSRIIAGIEAIQDGHITIGHNVTISYYAQNTADLLYPEMTVLQTVEAVSDIQSAKNLRTLLGCFLFLGEDVFKKVSMLSGGEKSRLALVKMLLTPSNLLILDEPTNHLDMKSKSILQQTLKRFGGTYIIVSHDRDFLAPLINKVFFLKSTSMELYHGTVDDYLEKQAIEKTQNKDLQKLENNEISISQREKERRRQEADKRHEKYKRLQPLNNKRNKIESEIGLNEDAKARIDATFADLKTYDGKNDIQSLNMEYDRINSQLTKLYDEWAMLEESIEIISNE